MNSREELRSPSERCMEAAQTITARCALPVPSAADLPEQCR